VPAATAPGLAQNSPPGSNSAMRRKEMKRT
jgi:hypothetical protein